MIAIPRIDECKICGRRIPWKWLPAVVAAGKALAGTGMWRSETEDGRCADCQAALEAERQKEREALLLRVKLLQVLGGGKPYRQYRFERYEILPGNSFAYERCKDFSPAAESLYLWGACGVGKTHLSYAVARRCMEETLSVTIVPAYKLSRQARMKDPDEEQAAINEWINVEVLVIDDLGTGPDTAYSRQLLQEILDGRESRDRAGLILTSAYSLDALAQKMGHDAIASRLAGMCRVVEIKGRDRRLLRGPDNSNGM